MSGPGARISPDGQWWWDGRQWVATQRQSPQLSPDERWGWNGQSWVPVVAMMIPIHRRVRLKYARDVEPPEIRARFGSILATAGFFLTLPAMGAGTIFSMAIATGQAPAWPTIGEGLIIFAIVLGLLGIWPLIGLLLSFGLRDGARWVLLCLTCSGLAPALVLGVLTLANSSNVGTDLATVEAALAWMWALPALGLFLLRVTRTGRPLPPVSAFIRMLGSRWREDLPAMQTEWGEVRTTRFRAQPVLSVPGADFAFPYELSDVLPGVGGRLRVTYELRAGRIETIEVGHPEFARTSH